MTGEGEAPAHGLGPVANPHQAKVTVLFAIQSTWVKATTVIANAKSQLIGGVFQNDFHLRRARVNCGVGDPLFANAQQVILDSLWQIAGSAAGSEMQPDVGALNGSLADF